MRIRMRQLFPFPSSRSTVSLIMCMAHFDVILRISGRDNYAKRFWNHKSVGCAMAYVQQDGGNGRS